MHPIFWLLTFMSPALLPHMSRIPSPPRRITLFILGGKKYLFEWTISPPKFNVSTFDWLSAVTDFTDVAYYVIIFAAYLPYWFINWSNNWVMNREISVWRHFSKRSRQVNNTATDTSIKFGLLVDYEVFMTVTSWDWHRVDWWTSADLSGEQL